MSTSKPAVGSIGWHDLTVPNAAAIRDFYAAVVGWKIEPVDMGGYDDFTLIAPASGDAVGGVCHARGANKDIPPQWLMYVIVADVDASAKACTKLGGSLVVPVRPLMGGRFCVIRDPAGAVCALFQS